VRKHPILSGLGLLILLIAIIGAASSKGKTSGPTKSPALVSSKAAAHSTPAKAKAKPQTFKGAGSENIGTINVPVASTLRWSCASCTVFSADALATDDTSSITVDVQNRTSGSTAVEAGTYKAVSVIADEGEGNSGWTITVTPGQ
jgi:hypothetical protein